MARPREFDPSEALDAIVDIFWARGYQETSMDDIVRETGVSRYGLYGNFGNKKDLLQASLWRYAERMMAEYHADLVSPDAGRAELEADFRSLIDFAETEEDRQGCFICKTAAEDAPHDEDIAKTIDDLFNTMVGYISKAIENGQRRGEIAATVDADKTARFLMTVKIGVTMQLQAHAPASNIEAAINCALGLLDG